jgi:hypothetical protein
MTEANSADAAEVVGQDEENSGEQYVTFAAKFAFESRRIRPADWVTFGAKTKDVEDREDTVWDSANGFRVSRADVPLTDTQLRQFMDRNAGFAVIKG